MSQSYAEQIIARQAALESKASNIRSIHQDCADYIMPRKGNIITERSPGEQQTVQLFDTTAEESLLIAAAGTLSQLTPPGEIWARIRSSEKEPSEALRTWFDQETQALMEDFHDSNFYLAWHETLLDLYCFCTGDVYLEEGGKRFFLNFCNTPVGTFVIAEDSEGFVDTVFKKWKWTARQAEQQWGRKALGVEVTKALNSNDPKDADKEFTFIHGVFPRKQEETRQGMVEGKLRPIASVYVCKEDKCVIGEEEGYYEMPHAVGRLLRSNGEAWGRGPGTQMLPEIKLVNRMEYDLTLALEKAVNPAWLSPDDAAYRPDNRPNGVTYYDATRPENKPELVKSEARIDLGEQKTEQKRERIRRGFFVDMFQMLNRPEVLKHERTAFQIGEMLQEKLLLFAPIYARLTLEILSPTIQRAFAMRIREGRTTPPPVDITGEGLGYRIEYTSKIALAIKAAQDNATVDMLQLCSLMAPFDQSVPLVVKWRDRFRAACRNRGLPAGDLRSDDEVDQMVAQTQAAAEAMQKADLAEKASQAAKNLGPRAQEVATNAVGQFKT